ncbi:CehA/McbA family metallohydrolase [Enterobacter sp.]|uniref:CehA/McbA family metallohydrolase n=1 Tax=Enterobacter sp. TaxID=42895 RepID=UPI00296FF3DD|nr:CehA/McbA family metallohydrolase [Enterobacter sp.]
MNALQETFHRTLTFTPRDEKQIARVDFTPGAGIEKIAVEYQVSGESVVDLGLEINGQVKGWSGGARRQFIISENFATEGYTRTAIVEGTWSVLLGLYKIRAACEVTVTVTLFKKHDRWLKGDTHLHSVHSDGKLTIAELISRAQAQRLDFLCFTDHNTTSQNREIAGINSPLCLIPGMELTSERGHANFTGTAQPVASFLPHFTAADIAARMNEARQNGARIGINHPFCRHCPWQNPLSDYDWLEIWNGPWDASTNNEQAFAWWYQQLCAGKRISVVAGSDFHKEKGLICAYTWTRAQSTGREDILNALAQGRSYLKSDGPTDLHQFCIGEAGPGETASGSLLHVSLSTHPDNRVLLYTDRHVITLPHNGNVDQHIDINDAAFALLRVNHGPVAQLITNPVYRG